MTTISRPGTLNAVPLCFLELHAGICTCISRATPSGSCNVVHADMKLDGGLVLKGGLHWLLSIRDGLYTAWILETCLQVPCMIHLLDLVTLRSRYKTNSAGAIHNLETSGNFKD
jgi:hypothetical protein